MGQLDFQIRKGAKNLSAYLQPAKVLSPSFPCSSLASHSHSVRPCRRPSHSGTRSAVAQTKRRAALDTAGFRSDTGCRQDQGRRRRRPGTEASEVEHSFRMRSVRRSGTVARHPSLPLHRQPGKVALDRLIGGDADSHRSRPASRIQSSSHGSRRRSSSVRHVGTVGDA